MDFRQNQAPGSRPAVTAAPAGASHKETNTKKTNKWLSIMNLVILFGVAILVAALAIGFTRGGSDNEFKYVDNSKYQAVFLNNGQVYFGNIDSLNNQYVRLSNIYYLTQNTTTSATGTTTTDGNYSLVKLGCQQIHDPLDEMLINRDQVTFWENLNGSGKVVTSINQFKKQNPNGPDCSQVSNQTQASSSSSTGTQSSTGTSTTTPTTTTTKP